MTVREMHGVARVRKVVAAAENSTQSVVITDAGEFVRIRLTACACNAELTPEEARFLADVLRASADRAERQAAEPSPPELAPEGEKK